ncbi:MAG: prepilin-type N-terminal cleavage/methylation domain-containing protein [Gallionellaceae bacterium]|jgi:type IV pilus assembly protein PilA
MMKIQKGFTLIELMIVVAIIGILAAVAIPSYQDYITKAKLSKVNGIIDPLKTAIALYYQENGGYVAAAGVSGSAGAGWTSLGINIPTVTNEVTAVNMSACATPVTGCDGSTTAETNVISITMGGIKTGVIDGGIIHMKPVISGTAMTWTNYCTDPAGKTMDPAVIKYFKINGNSTACSGLPA